MTNLKINLRWIDGLNQDNLLSTIEVTAESDVSSARQQCDLDTDRLRMFSDRLIEHSFCFTEEHSFKIDDRFGSTLPLLVRMHRATLTGKVPLEIEFNLEDEHVGRYAATVVVWTELGQLERFGRRLASLPRKGVGSSCELNSVDL